MSTRKVSAPARNAHRIAEPELQPAAASTPTTAIAQAAPLLGLIPLIFTHQQLIDAFYNAAHALGLDDWHLLNKAGLDVNQLAQDRQAVYQGPPINALPNLAEDEKSLVNAELIRQLRRVKKSSSVVNAPGGLNLRAGPSTEAAILVSLPYQTPVDVLHETGEWLFVATPEGNVGYLHQGFVGPAGKMSDGFLASMNELINAPLTPTTPIELGSNAGPGARLLAGIWNRYGGLLEAVATKLGLDPAQAIAVLAVESGGQAFSVDGRMIIRFENHLFYHYWGKRNPDRFAQHFTFNRPRNWEGHAWRASNDGPWQEFHGNQALEWQVFNFAASLDDTAARSSISMGSAQIMGFHHQRIGYPSVQAMFAAFQADERNQILGLFDFIRTDATLFQALRTGDYFGFAGGYNGPGQAQKYGGLIEQWVNAFAILRTAPATATFDVAAAPTPLLSEEVDAAIAFLPMPLPASIFIQVEPLVDQGDGAPASAEPTHLPMPQIEAKAPITDDKLYALWLKHIENGFENNNVMFKQVLRAFMIPYYMTVVMYCVLFVVGIGLFVLAVHLSTTQGTQLTALVFAGLSVASFISYFLTRPLRSLEENLQFITWLGIVYNTYWTRLLYMQNSATVHADLKDATADAVQQIEYMLNKNVEIAGRRPSVSTGQES